MGRSTGKLIIYDRPTDQLIIYDRPTDQPIDNRGSLLSPFGRLTSGLPFSCQNQSIDQYSYSVDQKKDWSWATKTIRSTECEIVQPTNNWINFPVFLVSLIFAGIDIFVHSKMINRDNLRILEYMALSLITYTIYIWSNIRKTKKKSSSKLKLWHSLCLLDLVLYNVKEMTRYLWS